MKTTSTLIVASILLLGFNAGKSLAATAEQASGGHECKVSCIEPTTACSESAKVLEVLKLLTAAFSKGDLNAYQQYIDEGCTTFDERSKKLVVGKKAVLGDIEAKMKRYGTSGETPLLAYVIDHPYAKVTGDTAVVTFVAVKELGGEHPIQEEAHVTDIFVKRNDGWKKLHYRANWKKISKEEAEKITADKDKWCVGPTSRE